MGIIDFLTWIEEHRGLAAWVQALASVAAIWWVGKLARMQLKEQKRAQDAADMAGSLRNIDSFVAMAAVALQEVGNAEASARSGGGAPVTYAMQTYERKSFEGLINALNAYPVHQLPTAVMVGAAQRFRDGFTQASLTTQEWTEAVRRKDARLTEERAAYLAQTFEYLSSQLEALGKAREELSIAGQE